jgi:SAM-dependent methyltransferase
MDHVRPSGLSSAIEYIQGQAEVRLSLSARFDVVTAFAVIEHCSDPARFAVALASFCIPGGSIVITTPLIGDLFERNTPGRTGWFCPPEHLHLLSKSGAQRVFEAAGCGLIHWRRFELNWPRWMARYGLAAAEGVAGGALRRIAPGLWKRLRNTRLARSQQMALYVFRKT